MAPGGYLFGQIPGGLGSLCLKTKFLGCGAKNILTKCFGGCLEMRIAVIGCGLIGEKRAKVLGSHELVAAADPNILRAEHVGKFGKDVMVTTDWQQAVSLPEVDLVIVATTNNWLTPVSLYALEQGKHVLVEKPAARSAEEIEGLVKKAALSECKVKVGFNLRYHPALLKVKAILDSGVLGELMFVRGRYGHGGRVGYDREWRADPKIAGGGELLDQGVHLIDLSRWILGDFSSIEGFVETYFWDMPVEDNGFVALRTKTGQTAWLQVSCSEWKNIFCFEIYGRAGKLQVDGIGGSYGVERLTYYKMLPEMGPPETTIWEFPGEDRSWKNEFDAFIQAITGGQDVCGDLNDANQALKVVGKIYGGKYNDYYS